MQFRHVGRIAAAAALALVPWLAGCAPTPGSPGDTAAQFAESLGMFIADFARQVLAAFLF
jgi:hypothetical protein